jgi:phage baseplate assembly protein W
MALVRHTTNINVRPVSNEFYSDFYADFDKHPDKNDLLKHTNDESIKRSIKNILQTNRGERLFNPTFGSNIRKLLFENISPVTESLIREQVETSINNFEPRAKLIDVVVSGYPDDNAYNITVVFSTLNTIDPIVLSVLLNRIR